MIKCYNAKTHAQFLNEKYATNYMQWYKSTWTRNDGVIVWMVAINGKTNKYSFRNTLTDGGQTIIEEYFGTDIKTIKRFCDTVYGKRQVVNVDKSTHCYTVLGIFEYDKNASDINKQHIWRKIDEE